MSFPYTLTASDTPGSPIPQFWLMGPGDLKSLSDRLSYVEDPHAGADRRWRAPTPYHARLLWAYADRNCADRLERLFPGYPAPKLPLDTPVIFAAADRLIGIAPPQFHRLFADAGFREDQKHRFWWTQNVRHALPLADIAEPELQRRLAAIEGLPFGNLSQVTLNDLLALPPPDEDGDASPEEALDNTRTKKEKPKLTFDHETSQYVCDSEEHSRLAGFVVGLDGGWSTTDWERANTLRPYAVPDAEMRLQAEAMMRFVPDPYMPDARPIPTNPSAPFPLGPDQIEGVRFLTTRSRSILADDMGVGKTAEVFGAINRESLSRVLIVAPPRLLRNWMAEADKWLAPHLSIGIFGRSKKRDELPNKEIILVSYKMLPKLTSVLETHWDAIYLDEAQEIINGESRQGRPVHQVLIRKTDRLRVVTGTPIWNRPQDLWTLLHAIAPLVFPFKDPFMACYRVEDPQKISPELTSRLDFLAHLLKSGLMIRRLKEDVLKDLPPKHSRVFPVPLPPGEQKRIEELDRRVDDLKNEANDRDSNVSRKARRTLFSEMARLRRWVGDVKYDYVINDVLSFIEKLDYR